MKVGTDGVLLGAWTDITNAGKILDVGTGSGVIALMLAQRSGATVHGVEIDSASAQQAWWNFENSAWSGRMNLTHSSFREFVQKSEQKYDLVVSNPPFYQHDLVSPKEKRAASKHALNMTHDHLLEGAMQLLDDDGKFSVILPVRESKIFIEKAIIIGLLIAKKTVVYPKPGLEPNRILLEFGRRRVKKEEDKLTIRNADGSYTREYKTLTADFYLDF